MSEKNESEPKKVKNETTVERKSEREFVVRRSFDGPARIVFKAFTKPELLRRWWTPKSMGMSLASCEVDVRAGGAYRFVIGLADGRTVTFFGKYIEVTPHSRLVWSNEEAGGEPAITTVTFEEKDGKTLLVFSEVHPTKEACDEAIGAGEFMRETFGQLDELLEELRLTAP